MQNETPQLTIYDFGYGRDLTKSDPFYNEFNKTQSSVNNQTNPGSIGSGQIINNISFGSEGYVGSIYTGNIAWDEDTGVITGGSGVLFYKGGLIGAASGVETFRLDAVTGNATFSGTLSATAGTIGGFNIGADYIRDAANTMGLASTVTGGDDVRFWAGAAFASRATAPFRVTEAGVVTASNLTITGGSVAASVLNGIIGQANLNIANRGWTQTCVFSVTDLDTVSWGAGSFISADGTSYSISGGNTGNMSAKTYIYFDTAVSTTAYQSTTTAATAIGVGKVLIAVAQNAAVEANFQVFGGNGGLNIDAASIVAGSITANEIAAGAVTSAKINVGQLSAITADMGALTAGTITLNSTGHIKSGQTDYNTGIGFFLGIHSSTSKFSIGDPSGDHMLWTGTELVLNGQSVTNVVEGATADINFGLFRGYYNDGFTVTVVNATVTRSLLTTAAQFNTGSTGWSVISPTWGSGQDFGKDIEFFVRLDGDTGLTWGGATEGRAYFWGIATGLSNLAQPSINTKARGTDIDQAGFGFIIGGDDNLYAWSSNGGTSGTTLGGIDLTDLSSITHTDFHNYRIEYHYAALPAISNTGAIRPTAHSGGNSNQANMYDGTSATAGFYERQSGGDIIRLSYDGGTNFTGSMSMTYPTTQGNVTVGGQYETWGRTWTPAEFSNANFRLQLGNASGGSDLWNGTFNVGITFSNFGFSTGTWVHITGIKVDLSVDTEDEGDGGIQEARIWDVQVTVYFTTAQGTGYVKFYVDETLVATHYVGIPVLSGGDPRITFLGGPQQANTSSGQHTWFNNYRVKITT